MHSSVHLLDHHLVQFISAGSQACGIQLYTVSQSLKRAGPLIIYRLSAISAVCNSHCASCSCYVFSSAVMSLCAALQTVVVQNFGHARHVATLVLYDTKLLQQYLFCATISPSVQKRVRGCLLSTAEIKMGPF